MSYFHIILFPNFKHISIYFTANQFQKRKLLKLCPSYHIFIIQLGYNRQQVVFIHWVCDVIIRCRYYGSDENEDGHEEEGVEAGHHVKCHFLKKIVSFKSLTSLTQSSSSIYYLALIVSVLFTSSAHRQLEIANEKQEKFLRER